MVAIYNCFHKPEVAVLVRELPAEYVEQYPVIHRYARYDLMLDTSVLSPAECAVKIKGYLEI